MALDDLIKAKIGDQPFAFYLTSGEGLMYPDETEETSGYVVAADGHHYFFWTSWNHRKHEVYLETWEPTDNELFAVERNAEYLAALEEVGLIA